jgi:hypothetical protein
MTTRDIEDTIRDIYGIEVSEGSISNITSAVLEDIKEWQQRPLEPVYFVVWMDGIVVKVRQNGKVQGNRQKLLAPFEGFVKIKLEKYPDTKAAQMHDWLKEHYPGFPEVTPKTVYNFVMWVRQRHNIPIPEPQREYCIVESCPGDNRHRLTSGSTICVMDRARESRYTSFPWFFPAAGASLYTTP